MPACVWVPFSALGQAWKSKEALKDRVHNLIPQPHLACRQDIIALQKHFRGKRDMFLEVCAAPRESASMQNLCAREGSMVT